VAYTAGGVSPIDRLRAAVRDTDDTSPIFPDTEYYSWLERAQSDEYIALYYPDGNSRGVTSATAQVLLSGTDLVLELIDNIDGTATVQLAPHGEVSIGDALDRLYAAQPRWKVGIGRGRTDIPTWIDFTAPPWRRASYRDTLRQFIDYGQGADLVVHRHGTLDGFGDEDDFARLHLYDFGAALLMALRAVEGKAGADGPYKSRSKANSSWTKGEIFTRLHDVQRQASMGIYSGAA